MTRRSRPIHLLLLLSLLWSSLGIPPKPADARPIAPPTAGSMQTPPLRNLPLPPGPPDNAYSTGYTAEDAEDLIADKGYDGPPSRGFGLFDGTFTDRGTSYAAGTLPDQILPQDVGHQALIFQVPAGTTSLLADVGITTDAPHVAGVGIRSRGVISQVWSGNRWVGIGYDSAPGDYQDLTLDIAANAYLTETIEVELACDGYTHTAEVGCSLTNIRLVVGVPGWSHAPQRDPNHVTDPGDANDAATRWAVRTTADTEPSRPWSVGPQSGGNAFLSIKNDIGGHTGAGWRGYQSPPIALPPFATGEMSATLRWSSDIGDPWLVGGEVTLALTNGGEPWTFFSTSAYSDQSWQTKVSFLTLHENFSAQVVRLQVWANLDRQITFGVDDIKFFYKGRELLLPIAPDSMLGACSCDIAGLTPWYFADPVNTFTGAFVLPTTDMVVPSSGPALVVDRVYGSPYADTTRYPVTSLGPGWRAGFQETLTLPHVVGGEPNTIIYEETSGSRLRFFQTGALTYTTAPGVHATLTVSGTDYVVTTLNQEQRIFGDRGHLLEARDAQGRRQVQRYESNPAAFDYRYRKEIEDLDSGRTLVLSYTQVAGQVRLAQITGPLSYTVQYGYTSGGYLETVTDPQGRVTTYGYSATTPKYLTHIWNPGNEPGTPQVVNTYTAGRVSQQVEASGRTITYAYALPSATEPDYITTMTVTTPGQSEEDVIQHHYWPSGMPRMAVQNGQFVTYQEKDAKLNPAAMIDGNVNPTDIATTAVGRPLTITNALGNAVQLAYNGSNYPTSLTAMDGQETSVTYDASHQMTETVQLATTGQQLRTQATYTADQQLETVTGPDGIVTHYRYDGAGNVDRVVHGYGSTSPLTTTYGYDALGRVVTVTSGAGTALETTTKTDYRSDNQPER